MDSWKDRFETGNSFFIACRNAVIIVFLGILLFSPSIIKSITKEAGIREIAGAKFDQEDYDKTAVAAESVTESTEAGADLAEKVSGLLDKKPAGSSFSRSEIRTILDDVQSLNKNLKEAEEKVGDKLADEQKKLVEQDVIAEKLSGWIYLGKATANKKTWKKGPDDPGDVTIRADKPPVKGEEIVLNTDVYVRDNVESSQKRNSAPIKGRALQGQKFLINEIDASKSLSDGGKATWARVTLIEQ